MIYITYNSAMIRFVGHITYFPQFLLCLDIPAGDHLSELSPNQQLNYLPAAPTNFLRISYEYSW